LTFGGFRLRIYWKAARSLQSRAARTAAHLRIDPMSDLNTFGAIMTHAVEMEAALRDYFAAASQPALAAAADKRRATMERVRRENVTEIKLELIEGLRAADYALALDDHSPDALRAAAAAAARFYADAAPKINVREAQRALERAGRDLAAIAAGQ
jgi:hypothetical protein